MGTLRALGFCLSYPHVDVAGAADELMAALLTDRRVATDTKVRIQTHFARSAERSQLDLEEHYSATFDGGRMLSLHLFEHVYGDSRKRGDAMVQLGAHYARGGFSVAVSELPDYLPLMLEFASVAPAVGEPILREASPVLKTLHDSMIERRCSYECFVAALLDVLAADAESRTPESPSAAVGSEAPVPVDGSVTDLSLMDMSELDLESLDRQWEEDPVTFGLGAAHTDCGTEQPRLITLRRSPTEAKDTPSALREQS